MNTENNIAIVCITDNGKNLAVKIQKKLKEGKIYFVKKKNNEEFQEVCNIGNDTYAMKNDKLELRQQNSKNIIISSCWNIIQTKRYQTKNLIL